MSDEGSRLFDETLIARHRLRKWVVVAAVVLVGLRLGAGAAPIMRVPDLFLLDLWQSVRGTPSASPQVVIVAVDEKSIGRFGPPPWPRSEYAPLVERLSSSGARVIGFDFTFGALEREAANNQILGEAMKKAGNVVFGYEFTRVGDPSPPGTPASELVQANALPRFESVAIPPASSLIEPEPVLAAAAALGHVVTVASEDRLIRVLPLVIQHGEKGYPSLGLQLARVYTGTPLQQIEVRDGAVTMGEWTIPVSASGEVLLNWPARWEKAFPQYSFLDVVRGDVPDEAFRGKAVIVAGTAAGLDDRGFPFAVKAPGVLSYATFLDNVFRLDFVQAPLWAWPLEWGLFFAACGLGVWLLPRLSTRLLLVGFPVLVLALLGAAAFLFVQNGIWVKVFYPALALVAPLGLVVALRLTASERETRDVAAEKLESQKLLGLSFQEKGMLDMALATFAKLPLTEDMKLVYANLGLDYENRGERDKAYRVYKKVFDADPGFEDVSERMRRLRPAEATPTIPPPAAPPGPLLATIPLAPPMPSDADLASGPTLVSSGPTVVSSEPLASLLGGEQPTLFVGQESAAPSGGPPGALASEQAPLLVSDLPTAALVSEVASPVDEAALISGRETAALPGAAGTPSQAAAVSAPSGPVAAGVRIGRYEVERHLGRGGMGDVYLVRDTVINRRVALKTIRLDAELDAQQAIQMRQRFYREAQTAGQLKHPNIVTIYDVAEDRGMSFIVMEYIEGRNVAQLMRSARFSVAQIKHVVYHAAIALDYAHQNGVFHRDIKPDNIMVSKGGTVTVMDFGLARIVESTLTRTGSVMGTPAYMSPEQVNGEKIDARSDIFSLGVILYEMLTGVRPFTGQTIPSVMFAIVRADPTPPSAVDGKIEASWDRILAKALAKNPDERYATAGELAQAVRAVPAR